MSVLSPPNDRGLAAPPQTGYEKATYAVDVSKEEPTSSSAMFKIALRASTRFSTAPAGKFLLVAVTLALGKDRQDTRTHS